MVFLSYYLISLVHFAIEQTAYLLYLAVCFVSRVFFTFFKVFVSRTHVTTFNIICSLRLLVNTFFTFFFQIFFTDFTPMSCRLIQFTMGSLNCQQHFFISFIFSKFAFSRCFTWQYTPSFFYLYKNSLVLLLGRSLLHIP